MKITSLTLHNFRCVEDLTLDLDRPLTVIAGLDNGDGKTTILEGIALAATALYAQKSFGRVSSGMEPNWRDDLRAEPNRPMTANDLIDDFDEAGYPESAHVQIKTNWGAMGRRWPQLDKPKGPAQRLHDAFVAGDDLPVLVYYSTDRSVLEWAKDQPSGDELLLPSQRVRAYDLALAARTNLAPTIAWFLDREALELRKDREARDQDKDAGYTDPLLSGVREAVQRAIPQCRRIRGASTTPPQIAIDWTQPDGSVTTLGLRQLSGGTRTQLALVLDLARRMCQANPKQGVDGEALVLIDEIDLHLHPKWQQTVVGQLRRAFPNVQFIMTTHSDQVLSSVKPESILLLDRRSGALTVRHPEHSYGRRSEDILEDEMGTPARAALQDELAEYESLVAQGEGRSDAAIAQRQRLEHDLPANDEALRRADNELRRQQFLASMTAQ